MRPPDVSFIRRCVKRYYFEQFDRIEIPLEMAKREFGYRKADAGMVRHIQLHEPADLRVLLLQAVPLDVYVSNARYLLPAQPIAEKVWENADVIFDIDAKDLDMKCRPSHTVHMCAKCGYGSTDTCGKCGHKGTQKVSVTCPLCIKAAGEQVSKLLEILADDLGVSEGVRVYFSGNEGFHVHVRNDHLATLGAAARAELADYVAFRGVIPDRMGVKRKRIESLPKTHDGGWGGRFAREVFRSKAGRARAAKDITAEGYDVFARKLAGMEKKIGVNIDPGVTMDIHRIFRMSGTINGKSCMAKVPCADTKGFNPYVSAVVISDEPVGIRASCPIPFKMMNTTFGPYSNEYVEVPSYAAAYMVCKGLACVTD